MCLLINTDIIYTLINKVILFYIKRAPFKIHFKQKFKYVTLHDTRFKQRKKMARARMLPTFFEKRQSVQNHTDK